MRKLIFGLVFMTSLVMISACGGGNNVFGDLAVVDKNNNIVGYVSSTNLTFGIAFVGSAFNDPRMQDLNGNWVDLEYATGKLYRNDDVYFSTENCGGSVYVNNALMDLLYKTYPFMTDSTKTAVDATASEKTYNITGIATGTETVKSYLVRDTVYSDANQYNAGDSSTFKYKCVTVAKVLTDLGLTAAGQCINAGQVTCSDTVEERFVHAGTFCQTSCGSGGGTFTPYTTPTELPLTDETYSKTWGVLTEVTAQDITDKKVIVDYSAVAPLKVEAFN